MTDRDCIKWIREQTGYREHIWIKHESQYWPDNTSTHSVWISGENFAVSGPDANTAAGAAVRELKCHATKPAPNPMDFRGRLPT